MNRLLAAAAGFTLATGVLVGGCGGGSSAVPDPDPEAVGLLRKVAGPAELEASIKAGFTTIHSSQALDGTLANVAAGATSVGTYSRTYTQEVDVDEFDSVKYDGEYLFVAPTRGPFPCCFITDEPFASTAPAPPAERSIRIFATDPPTAGAAAVSTIPLEDGVSVQGLYRSDDRLVALTSELYLGGHGDPWASIAIWVPGESGLRIYDTSDISDPVLIFEAAFDGFFIESRRIGDIVYVVSRYTPDIEGLHYQVTNAAEQAANEEILAEVSLDELLPTITINGAETSLVTPANCYVPSNDVPAYPVITSITAIPIGNPDAFQTTCYDDDAYGIYVSPTAMYLAQSAEAGQGTRIHKFALGTGAPDYRGSGEIEGIVWTGGQADFRLSEQDGILRAFASSYDGNSPDFIDHHLYVLREAATGQSLEVVSQLPNDARPEEIGKPNEQLYGVRFVGDRAYAVTFERIDPLYVFDLADPEDPRVAGTLEITGFSDFLHPVTDDLLLGLGTSADNAIKLELFDVSVPSQPLSVGRDILGGPWSFSEAMYDRHAFTYLADVDGVDRFTIPADLTGPDGVSVGESGLYLYEIRDKATPSLSSLNRVGNVVVPNGGENGWYGFRNRSVLHDDAVYYVRGDEVYSVLWNMPAAVAGPH